MIVWISLILIFVSFSAKWIMDTLQFHYDKSIYKTFNNQDYWNPILSYDNKYILGSAFIRWVFKNPLVFLTDAWHLFQFISLNSVVIAVSLLICIVPELQILAAIIIKPILNYQITIFVLSFLTIRAMYSIAGIIFYK